MALAQDSERMASSAYSVRGLWSHRTEALKMLNHYFYVELVSYSLEGGLD
jgi:hypothetical protein